MPRSHLPPIVGAIAQVTLGSLGPCAAAAPVLEAFDAIYPDLDRLYLDLHQHPELSLHEVGAAKVLS